MRLALFDLDGTVLRGNSWHEYFWWSVRQRPAAAPWLLAHLALRRARLTESHTLARVTLGPLRGQDPEAVAAVGRQVFADRVGALIRPAARREIARCVADGCVPVLATATMDFLAFPVAAELGVREVIATRLEYAAGKCQGRWLLPEPRGVAKAAAVQARFAGQAVDWAGSRAYSDEAVDLPLLGLVGEPVFVTAMRPAGLDARIRSVDWDAE